jgi:quercetin dioxygenase-like cupin family protein
MFQAAAMLAPLAGFANAAAALSTSTLSRAEAKHEVTDYGETWLYFDGPSGQLASLTTGAVLLHPGKAPHPPHQHPDEEMMLVAEGSGEISLDGKAARVQPGSMMFCEGNRVHGILNTGAAPLTFYYWKWRR